MPTAYGLTSTVGSDSWASGFLDHLFAASVFGRIGARRVPVAGRQAKLPRLVSDPATVTWLAEGGTLVASAPQGDVVTLLPKKATVLVNLTNESIQDASFDEAKAVAVSMARSVAAAIDTQLLSATASSATLPGGILSADFTLPTSGLGALSLAKIIAGIAVLEGKGATADSIIVNATDLAFLRNLLDTTGRPLLGSTGNVQDLGALQVGGAKIYLGPIPAGKVLIAQADQLLLGVGKDVSVELSPDAGFTTDSTLARAVARVCLGVNDVNGLYVVTVA